MRPSIVTGTLASPAVERSRTRSPSASPRRSPSTGFMMSLPSFWISSRPLALVDIAPEWKRVCPTRKCQAWPLDLGDGVARSEEHTSELQSQSNLVCRLLLEKKKKKIKQHET